MVVLRLETVAGWVAVFLRWYYSRRKTARAIDETDGNRIAISKFHNLGHFEVRRGANFSWRNGEFFTALPPVTSASPKLLLGSLASMPYRLKVISLWLYRS